MFHPLHSGSECSAPFSLFHLFTTSPPSTSTHLSVSLALSNWPSRCSVFALHGNQTGDVWGFVKRSVHMCLCLGVLVSHCWLKSMHVRCKQKWKPTYVNSESVNTSHSLCGGGESIWYMAWGFLDTAIQWKGTQLQILMGPKGTLVLIKRQKVCKLMLKKVLLYCKEAPPSKKRSLGTEQWLKVKISIFITLFSIE